MAEHPTDNPTAQPPKKKRHGCLKGCLVVIGLILLFIVYGVVSSLDLRSDKSVLKSYQPSAVIADVVLQDTMTDKAKATLYRTDPRFVGVDEFRTACVADGIEGLACTDTVKTTFLQIDDPEFVDHKYSAAAHEMLHVAYDRLKKDEIARVNALLDQEMARHQDDTYLTGVLKTLKEKRAGDTGEAVYSEMHSKFGVEFTDLIPELESHYQQYFVDRAQVVKLYRNGGFNSRVRRLDQLEQEGKALETKLTALDGKMRGYQAAGDIDSFNSLVGQYNSMVKQYNGKAAESKKVYAEVERFFRLFNPNYQPPQDKAEQ